MVPLNPLTEYLDTVHSDGSNFRVFMGAPTKHIKSWQISKMQDISTPARGVKQLTLYQDEVQPEHDLIDVANKEFYADYYSNGGLNAEESPIPNKPTLNATITTASSTIRTGGSYKTLKLTITDELGEDVTDTYLSITPISWTCSIDDVDMTYDPMVVWLPQTESYVMKIKLNKDNSYLGKILTINCTVDADTQAEIKLSII